MSESGCKNRYESVLGAGAKAKSVTNNLPILSVLGLGEIFKLSRCYEVVSLKPCPGNLEHCTGRLLPQTYISTRFGCFDFRDVPARGEEYQNFKL